MEKRLIDILICPASKGKLTIKEDELWSRSAALAYPVRDGIPVLIEAEARALSSDELATLK